MGQQKQRGHLHILQKWNEVIETLITTGRQLNTRKEIGLGFDLGESGVTLAKQWIGIK